VRGWSLARAKKAGFSIGGETVSQCAEPEFITQIDFDRFEVAFRTSDVVGAGVRCLYEIERAALRSLTTIIPKYQLLKHRYLSDHLKTYRAISCQGPIFQVADYVNKVRNEFAHDGIEELTSRHWQELFSQAGNGFGTRNIRDWIVEAGVWGMTSDKTVAELTNQQAFVFVSALGAGALDTLPQRIPKIIHLDHL
jgi:hypothetical protein